MSNVTFGIGTLSSSCTLLSRVSIP